MKKLLFLVLALLLSVGSVSAAGKDPAEKVTGGVHLMSGENHTYISFNAHEGSPAKGYLVWDRTGTYANHLEGNVISAVVNGTEAEFTINITVSTEFPDWVGDQLKFTTHDGGTPGTNGDAIMWQWVTGPYVGGPYGEPIVGGNLVSHHN